MSDNKPSILKHVDEFGDPHRKAVALVLRQIAGRLETHFDPSGVVLQQLFDDLAELGYVASRRLDD